MVNLFVFETYQGLAEGAPPRGIGLQVNNPVFNTWTWGDQLWRIMMEIRVFAMITVRDFADDPANVRGHLQIFVPHRARAHVSSRPITINDIDIEAVEDLFQKLHQSNDDINLLDVEFDYFFCTIF